MMMVERLGFLHWIFKGRNPQTETEGGGGGTHSIPKKKIENEGRKKGGKEGRKEGRFSCQRAVEKVKHNE